MVEKDCTYVVMGLLDPDSIAYYIGQTIESFGGKVVFTAQNERMKRLFLDRSKKLSEDERARLDIRYCDVTNEDEVKALFSELNKISGVVHSIAYVNPKTGLGDDFHTDAVEDLKDGFNISCVSLATVTRYAQHSMTKGGSVVAMTFDTKHVFPFYNWMGVNKAALEAIVRGLARRHGRDLIRINAVSAGPLATKAAKNIPGFSELGHTWEQTSPLPWDVEADKQQVANAVAFFLGPYSQKITGEILYVDGGASHTGGQILAHERVSE